MFGTVDVGYTYISIPPFYKHDKIYYCQNALFPVCVLRVYCYKGCSCLNALNMHLLSWSIIFSWGKGTEIWFWCMEWTNFICVTVVSAAFRSFVLPPDIFKWLLASLLPSLSLVRVVKFCMVHLSRHNLRCFHKFSICTLPNQLYWQGSSWFFRGLCSYFHLSVVPSGFKLQSRKNNL